ncbi:coiled coil protein, putative [Perkinsus marinus ATCC 50983]|uniref:Coiled coil protein, putative n=1 Tax=Perkinsus marinus (strain ATCC 50983 / TXsc) TaxID=423536 RepID=C5KUG4_PERM5|nr:coiled coil protein, putative [Perkinsus marinus ATCC 50983]EER11851.1 coiled coil protein, putative [Perkinsus marinus ATCC 50983]|eukprot:XP_002780056.1 coiled coil protein, putative [Perkinsus marinus ATCC 50983]
MEANQPSISDQQRILSQFDSDASITPESLLHEGAAAHAMLLQPMRGYWSDWTTWYCDKYFWWQWCGTVAFKRTEALRDKIKKMAARVKQAETESQQITNQMDQFRLNDSMVLVDPEQKHDGLTSRASSLLKAVLVEQPAVGKAFEGLYPKMRDLEDEIKSEVDMNKQSMADKFTETSQVVANNLKQQAKHVLGQTVKMDKNLHKALRKLSRGVLKNSRTVAKGSLKALKEAEKDSSRVERKSGKLLDTATRVIAIVNKLMANTTPSKHRLLMTILDQLKQKLFQQRVRQQSLVRPYEQRQKREMDRERKAVIDLMKRDSRAALYNAEKEFSRGVNGRLSRLRSQRAVIQRTQNQDLSRENKALREWLSSEGKKEDSVNRKAADAGEAVERQLLASEESMIQHKRRMADQLQEVEGNLKAVDNVVDRRLMASSDSMQRQLLGESELINGDLKKQVDEERERASGRNVYFEAQVGDVTRQAAIEKQEEARGVDGAERNLANEESRAEHDIASAGQKQEVRVRSLLEHGKGEVDGVAGAIASGGADELSRLDSIMSSLTATKTALTKSMEEDMGGVAEAQRGEFSRLRENVNNAYNDTEDGMFELDRVLSSMVGGMQSSVDGQEDLRKGLQGMSAILEKEAAKANGDIRDITGESAMALRHRSAEFKQEEVDAVRDVDGVLDNAIGGMKGRMKDEQKGMMRSLRGMLSELGSNEEGVSAVYDEAQGGLARVATKLREYKGDVVEENNKLQKYLVDAQGQEAQAALKIADGVERDGLARIAQTRKLLMEARQKAEEGTSERDKQRARELRDEISQIDDMLNAAVQREYKSRAALASVDSIGDSIRNRGSAFHDIGVEETQNVEKESERFVTTRRDLMQQLARYKNEIERARGSLARGVQVLDRGVRDRTEDMKESIKLGREGLARIVGGIAAIMLKAWKAELEEILNGDMTQDEKVQAIRRLLESGRGKFGHDAAAVAEERNNAATKLAFALDSIIKQAGKLGLSGDEMHAYVQRKLEKEAGVTTEEFERVKAQLGGDLSKFKEMMANEKSKAIEMLKEQEVGEALRASSVDTGLGDLGNALLRAALEDGGQLGYNSLAAGRYISDARSTEGVFAHEARSLAHSALAMDQKLLEDIAAEKGVKMEETARVEHVQASFVSLVEDALVEIQKEMNRTSSAISSIEGLGGPSDELEKNLGDLAKRTATANNDLDKLKASYDPIFDEMKKKLMAYGKEQRKAKDAQLKEKKSIQKRFSAVDSELGRARSRLWAQVQGNIAKDVQAYQKSFAEGQDEFNRKK